MKTIVVLLTCMLAAIEQPCKNGSGYGVPPSTYRDSLLTFNYNSFIGKPVDSLIKKLPSSYKNMRIYGGSRASIARKLSISYDSSYAVKIFVDGFRFMNPKDYEMKWDLDLFRKETIAYAILYADTVCINCNEEYY